ncbi:putative EF-hand domain-containing protein [Helianthus anomalus]
MNLSFEDTSHTCPFKSLSNKVGGILRCNNSSNRYERLDSRLERKMVEAKNNNIQTHNTFRSMDSIILRFPRFKEGLKAIQSDSNGTIDNEELKKCLQKLQKLQFECTAEEIRDLFVSCDIDGSNGRGGA